MFSQLLLTTLLRAGEYTPEDLASTSLASLLQRSLKRGGDLYLGRGRWFEPHLLQMVSLQEKAMKEAGMPQLCQHSQEGFGLVPAYSWLPFDPFCLSVTRGIQGSKLAAVGCVLILRPGDKVSVLTRCTRSGSSRQQVAWSCGFVTAGELNVDSDQVSWAFGINQSPNA